MTFDTHLLGFGMSEKSITSMENGISHEEWETDFRGERKSWLRAKHLLWFLIALGATTLIFVPFVKTQGRIMDMSHSLSNGRAVFACMMDFENDFGHFPDDISASSSAKMKIFRGEFSNDYLGQLIAGGYLRSEEIFCVSAKAFPRQQPDDVISPPDRILEKNECGFAYVMREVQAMRQGLSSSDPRYLPLLVTPLVNRWGSFERTSFQHCGGMICIDGTAKAEHLRRSDNKIVLKNGLTLFDTGSGTVWGNVKPVVLLPER